MSPAGTGPHLSWRCFVASALCSSSMTRLGGSGRWTAVRCGDPVGVDSCPRRGGSELFTPGPWKSTAWPGHGDSQHARETLSRTSALLGDGSGPTESAPLCCHSARPHEDPGPAAELVTRAGISFQFPPAEHHRFQHPRLPGKVLGEDRGASSAALPSMGFLEPHFVWDPRGLSKLCSSLCPPHTILSCASPLCLCPRRDGGLAGRQSTPTVSI